jgi:alkanesulfonate monooxygenase SsuD/methylene tetrahydromethanopterin reductase-like flavin-dependent oxidoreductase (luciferase family)
LPEEYSHTYDPFVALTAAAVVTERIALGTGICLVAQRDPIQLAKEAASLDRISNGRLVLGIGAGWNVEEMRNHGTPFESRWEILRERVLAMREIWTKDRYLYPSHRERKTSGEHNGIGEAGDRSPLAPSRLPALLALAVEAWAAISRSRGS